MDEIKNDYGRLMGKRGKSMQEKMKCNEEKGTGSAAGLDMCKETSAFKISQGLTFIEGIHRNQSIHTKSEDDCIGHSTITVKL